MTVTARRVIILGAGGHARVVLALLRATGAVVEGCLAPDHPDSRWPADVPWSGDDTKLRNIAAQDVLLANGIGSVADCRLRRAVFERSRSAGFQFVTLCHRSAVIETDVVLGERAQVMAGAILQTGVRIGAITIVNTGTIVDHDSVIGDHAHVAPGARLSGGVTVGPAAHVGTGATGIQGVAWDRGRGGCWRCRAV